MIGLPAARVTRATSRTSGANNGPMTSSAPLAEGRLRGVARAPSGTRMVVLHEDGEIVGAGFRIGEVGGRCAATARPGSAGRCRRSAAESARPLTEPVPIVGPLGAEPGKPAASRPSRRAHSSRRPNRARPSGRRSPTVEPQAASMSAAQVAAQAGRNDFETKTPRRQAPLDGRVVPTPRFSFT